MKLKLIYRNLLIALCLLGIVSCDQQWDDHVDLNESNDGKTVLQVLASIPEASEFVSLLQKTGYDELLSGTTMLTVFVPDNNALANVNTQDDDELKLFVQNHISYAANTVNNQSFIIDTIQMINGKRLIAAGKTIDGVNLSEKFNIKAANGIIHIVNAAMTPKLNIWEYLQQVKGNYIQTQYIKSLDFTVMDPDKSVQTGIDENGNAIYDTVPLTTNAILDVYPLDQEEFRFSFVLLEQSAVTAIETKYSKYFVRPDQSTQDSIVRGELAKDLIFLPVQITSGGTYVSLDGVSVKINNITESYQASNGTVYVASDAEIKIYENKIKTIIIEAEDYYNKYSDGDAWNQRYRTWASGGQDMVLNSYTRNYATDTNEDGEEVDITYRYFFVSQSQTGLRGRQNNNYIAYKQTLNSVAYKMYARAYDDVSTHYIHAESEWPNDPLWYPMEFEEKLLMSFPDANVVSLTSENTFVNNFSNNAVFAMKAIAGEGFDQNGDPVLSPFVRYQPAETDGVFLLGDEFTGSDQYGNEETIICPRYGEATIIVANTTRETGENGGMIFLDYLKFVPVVDQND